MPANPIKRPSLTLRIFTAAEQHELRRLAQERGCTLNDLLSAQLGPLRKLLQQRLTVDETNVAETTAAKTTGAETTGNKNRRPPRADELPPRAPRVHRLNISGR